MPAGTPSNTSVVPPRISGYSGACMDRAAGSADPHGNGARSARSQRGWLSDGHTSASGRWTFRTRAGRARTPLSSSLPWLRGDNSIRYAFGQRPGYGLCPCPGRVVGPLGDADRITPRPQCILEGRLRLRFLASLDASCQGHDRGPARRRLFSLLGLYPAYASSVGAFAPGGRGRLVRRANTSSAAG